MGFLRIVWLTALLLVPTLALGEGAGPAVSDANGKFSVEGGEYDSDKSALALGSYVLPLGHAFGLQMDGALGRLDHDTMGGGGLHLFTRDPSSYLFGIYGSYHSWNSIDIWRAAAEFQLYLSRFSLEGLAGYEGIDVPSLANGLTVLNTDDNHFFAHADLAYYLTGDLRIYGGYRYVSETSLGAAGIEYLMRDYGSPISLFAKSDFGDDQFNRITGGLKIYLGHDPDKSLIARHRTEDPENYTPKFPNLITQAPAPAQQTPTPTPPTPECTIDSDFLVVTPADGDCLCPAGTIQAGLPPTPLGGGFSCGNPG